MVRLFHQPGAGERSVTPERLLERLRAAGIRASYQSLKEDGWRERLAETRELAIAAGGDGTVGRLATAMPDRSVPLAILPLGSGNNVAKSLGYQDTELDHVIAGLARPRRRHLRIGEARGRWGVRLFVESVGLGALARSTAELENESLDGPEKLARGRAELARTVRGIAPLRLSLFGDDEPLDEPALLVECMNIGTIGPNLRLGLDADPGGDYLSLVWLPTGWRDDFLGWLEHREGAGPAPVRSRKVRSVTFQADDERLRIDDKTVTWDGSHMSLRLLQEPVTVVLPGAPP